MPILFPHPNGPHLNRMPAVIPRAATPIPTPISMLRAQKRPEVRAKRGLVVNDKTERLVHTYLAFEHSSGMLRNPGPVFDPPKTHKHSLNAHPLKWSPCYFWFSSRISSSACSQGLMRPWASMQQPNPMCPGGEFGLRAMTYLSAIDRVCDGKVGVSDVRYQLRAHGTSLIIII